MYIICNTYYIMSYKLVLLKRSLYTIVVILLYIYILYGND